MKRTCTKKYTGLPAAHRLWTHERCGKIHGHNWDVEIELTADLPDEHGFQLDFGGEAFKEIKSYLEGLFDHTLLVDTHDPLMNQITELAVRYHAADLRILDFMPTCEALASYLCDALNKLISKRVGSERNVRIVRVTVWEDAKNSSTFNL